MFGVDRSAVDNSPRSIHDLKVDLPWTRPGLLPNVQPPLLPRNISLPAFPFATTTTHQFTPLPPPPKPSEKELWQKRVHEAFVNGQKYKAEPWLNPEFRATIERTPAPRALEINDVLHAPGRTSRPSSYIGTVTFGPNEEVKTSLGGEDGFRNWYYGEEARSLPSTYGMRRELPASAVEKKPKAELSFARQPSTTNVSRAPSIKSRSNSRSYTRSQQAVLSSLHPSAATIPNTTNNNDNDNDGDGNGEPWWVADERQDYAEYMDALTAEDRGGPAVGTLDDWLKMREARRRARFEREEKAERRRSLTTALGAGDSTTSLAGAKTPLLMRRLSSSRTAMHQHQAHPHPQALTPSKPSTRAPSPPSGVARGPETAAVAPTECHIFSLNDDHSPPYRISVVPRRHSLLSPYTNKDPTTHIQPQRPRGFSRTSGAASPRSPLGLHTTSRQSFEDVTIIPPPVDFSALTLDTALALALAPAPAPTPAPTPAPAPAPAPAPESPSASAPVATSASLPDKKPPPRSPTSPKSPTRRARPARPARPRGLSAISYLRPLEPIVLPNMAKAVPTRADRPVAALSAEDHNHDGNAGGGNHEHGHEHEHAHASGSGSGSDSSGTLVSYGSGSTRVGVNISHDGYHPFKHPASTLDVGKMSKVDEVREDGELSKSPAELSLSRAYAAAGRHHHHHPHPQTQLRSPSALFTRPMSLVWPSGQDVQRPHSPGKVKENASRRHSLWVLFGSVRS